MAGDEVDGPKGLDAHLDAAIEAHEVAVEAAPVEAKEVETKPEPITGDDGRVRDPATGQFIKKDSAEARAPVIDGQAKVDAKAADPLKLADTAATQQVVLPDAWSAEWKAKIATLPPEQQQLVLDQYKAFQGDYTRKSQEFADQRKTHEPLLNAVQQVSPFLQQLGYTPDRFLTESAVVAQRLMTGQPQQKGEALAYLAQLHRIPPEAVLRAMGISIAPDGQPQAPSPELQQLRQQVFDLTQAQQQSREYQTQQERLRAQAEFDSIGQSKDQSGAPKYPHFDRVKGTMVKLVANDLATTWDQAYTIAVRGDDELYKQTVESERQGVAVKAEAERQAAVEKAKKAQPVKTSSSSPGGGTQRKGLDAHLEAALERAGIA